jgi:hypothetical protein
MSSCASCSTDSSRANSLCAAACAARFSQQSCAATAVPGAVQLVRVEFDGTAADENHLIIIEKYIIIILVRNSSARASLHSAPHSQRFSNAGQPSWLLRGIGVDPRGQNVNDKRCRGLVTSRLLKTSFLKT